jgi:hypothetical protein
LNENVPPVVYALCLDFLNNVKRNEGKVEKKLPCWYNNPHPSIVITLLQNSKKWQIQSLYLRLKQYFGRYPGFFLEISDWLQSISQKDMAIR